MNVKLNASNANAINNFSFLLKLLEFNGEFCQKMNSNAQQNQDIYEIQYHKSKKAIFTNMSVTSILYKHSTNKVNIK